MRAFSIAALACLAPLSVAAQDLTAWEERNSAGTDAVRGIFIERAGGFTFVPADTPSEPDQLPPIRVLNPEAVSDLATGVELEVDLRFDPQSQQAEIDAYEVAPSRGGKIPGTDLPIAATPLAKYRAEISRLLQPGAMSADILESANSPLRQTLNRYEREASVLYRESVEAGNAQQRTAAIRQIAVMRRESKAIFGPTIDNYDPWTYEKIHLRSRSVIALADSSLNRPICSGFLVAANLVMTAGHCFKAGEIDGLEIWFGFEETENNVPRQHARHIVTDIVFPAPAKQDELFQHAVNDSFSKDFLDLAVLRFSLTECANGQACAEIPTEVQPSCLRTRRIHRDLPLYLIGYPKGKRAKVHDNARMYLPHSITKFTLADIRKEIEVEFATLPEADRVALVDDLTASYQLEGGRFKLFDQQFGGQPKFGLVADTFKGNSGSPVFFRNDHCVAGMLIGGAPDTGERLVPSWINHESAVPMSALLQAIAADPNTAPLLDRFDKD